MKGWAVRQALRSGKRVYGTHAVSLGAPFNLEMLCRLEMDFAFICTEHMPVDRAEAAMMCRYFALNGVSPMVRIAHPSPQLAAMFIDGGAEGVVAPYVERVEDVLALIGAVRYRPIKGRFLEEILAGTRVPKAKTSAFLERFNRDRYLIIGVESVAAIENLEQLIAHDGVDAVFLGPHDITCSMEIPEEYDNPQFVATVLDVIRRCRALGKGVGIHMDAVSDLCRPYLDAGMNFVLNAADATKMHARLNEDFRSLRARYGDPFRREEAGADGPKGCLVQAGPAKRKRTPAS